MRAEEQGGPERYRPQFHYTVEKGWINDPIGLVVHDGEYHLFNDHNPVSCRFPGGLTDGEQSHWSHAISRDMVHWSHMPIALYPDANGACWSGSGVVDAENTAGFRQGSESPLVLVYTSAGKSFGQSLAYSNDRGRTWRKYEGNPVIQQIAEGNRDPKVFWHEQTRKWVMVLYVKLGMASFFVSDDLKHWTPTSEVELDGFHECPDMFELPVDGDTKNTKWVLHDARFHYWTGSFDGRVFRPEIGPVRGDHGSNFYAAQSWQGPDGRRIQIGWMSNGRYPDMPFNQQMSFPCEMALQTEGGSVRLVRRPIREVESLYVRQCELTDKTVKPGENPLADVSGELFDIKMEIEAGANAEFGIRLHGAEIGYARGMVSCLGCTADAPPRDGRVKLRAFADRTSLEVFANDGEVSMSSCFLPESTGSGLEFYTGPAGVRICSLRVTKLRPSVGGES